MSTQILHFFFESTPYTPRVNYILDFIEHHPLCPAGISFRKNGRLEEGELGIYYGVEKKGNGFFIPTQRIAFNNSLPVFSKLQPGTYRSGEILLYSVEENSTEAEGIFCQNKRFSFDLIEMIFFHITRMEEHYCTPEQMDQWDMMKSSEQFLSKNGLHEQPVVDRLVYCFFRELGLEVSKRPTDFSLSHDIDAIEKFPSFYKLLRASARFFIDGRGFTGQCKLLKSYWKVKMGREKDPFDTFNWLLQGCSWSKKTIYFLAGGITRYDNFFDVRDDRVKEIIGLAKQNGYDLGIHPSYAAWTREDLFSKEKEELEEVVGERINRSRQHFLHFSFEKTPFLIENHKLKYDSSLGFQDLIGFRCGTGFNFQLYNFKDERAFDFLENPLVVMDTALLSYVGREVKEFEKKMAKFLEENKILTRITFNFHNSTFDEAQLDHNLLKKIYQNICRREEKSLG